MLFRSVLNRVVDSADAALGSDRASAAAQVLGELAETESAAAAADDRLTAALLSMHADRAGIADRQTRLAERFTAAHPTVPVTRVPALAEDVHDLEGLRRIGALLAGS